jgi:signal transduction histidine kinase
MGLVSRFEAGYAWTWANPFRFDLILTGGFAALFTFISFESGLGGFENFLDLALIIPLAWRRSRPAGSAAVIAALGFVQLMLSETVLPADFLIPLSLYSLSAYGPRWAVRAGLAVAFVGMLLAGARYWSVDVAYLPLWAGFASMMLLASWALGTMRRLRKREEDRLVERAHLLEQERAQEVRLAATAERARIAREMHDVVAHSLSVTISQADGGRYAAGSDPEAAVTALETISVTGRQALNDMRALLGVLRQDDDRPLAPQPDADTIPDLVEQIRDGGLDVSLEITGRAQKLPPGPALAAYRIVQESLTNVLKHAGPTTRAWVRLDWLSDALAIEVLDDGRGAGAGLQGIDTTGGQGIRGMTERAVLHGGQLKAAPRPGGGFAVQARLPYGGAA